MESNFHRYATFAGLGGCLLGFCLMYPGSFTEYRIYQRQTTSNVGWMSYDYTDTQFLVAHEQPEAGYQLKSFIPGATLTKCIGFGVSSLAAMVLTISASIAQSDCEDFEIAENVNKLVAVALHQQKKETEMHLAAKKYELDESIDFKLYQEDKRLELLRTLTQNPRQTEGIDTLYYQVQEGFYDNDLPQIAQSNAEPLNQSKDEAYSPSQQNSEPLNQSVEPLNQPTGNTLSYSEARFTPLALNRLQVLGVIDRMRSAGLNQTEIIEQLWQVKKGGSAGWNQAYAEFKELTNKGEDA